MRFSLARPAVLFCFSCVLLSPQESTSDPITTERPTAGYSADVIPGGSLEVENGAGMSGWTGHYVVDLPESLVRLGLFNRFEVRFQTSNAVYWTSPAAGSSNLQSADVAVSGKFLIGRANLLLPRSGILSLSVPTGGTSVTSGSYDPGGVLIWTQPLRHGYSFTEAGFATLTTLNGARKPVWAPSLEAGKALSDKFSLFVEVAPSVLQDRSVSWYYDGGFALLPTRNRQIDVRAGYLTDATGSHVMVAVGLSLRRENFLPWLGRQSPIR